MRLLAYGGTGYYERQRIGAWENAPRDALDDSFRLTEEQLTFGLCLIEKEPMLVVRQLQVTDTGRTYAYSLLLDPGATVWDRFEWDAAALAASLFDESIEMSRLLLEQPEKVNAQDLQKVLDTLNRREDHQPDSSTSDAVNDYEAAWIGASFTPSISSWPPKVFGFQTRPTFTETSNLLWRLPPCFRAGLGWLIGGSGQSGRSFGAQFAIDDKAELEATTDELVSRGREIHQALQTLSNDDEFADVPERLRKKPVWGWADDADKNSGAIAERLMIIAALLRQTDGREALLQSAVESLPDTNFLDLELRKAWHRAAFSLGKTLTPEQTSFAMQNHFDFGLRLGQSDVALLNEDRLAEKFVEAGLTPSDSDVLHLPLAARHKVWLTLLSRTPEPEDVPGIFFSAVKDLAEENESESYVELLNQAVLRRMLKDKSFSLLHWRHYANNPLWPSVKTILRDIALARVQSGINGWQLEYLFFAEDDGGHKLLEAGVLPGQLRAMIKMFVDAVETRQAYGEQARKWLLALAHSEIRTMGLLSLEDKLRIANAARETWINYLDLWEAYNNQAESFQPWRLPSNDEREILLQELDELIRRKPARGFVPDLGGLEMMLGELPPKTLAYFQRLSPNFSRPEEAHKWVTTWRSKDPKRASKEAVRYFLECDGAVFSDYWLTPEFEEKEMENLFKTLMFQANSNRDQRYQRRLRELLTKAQGNKRVLHIVRQVFKEGIENEASAKVFCKRFAGDRESLNALMRCLSKTTTGIALTDALARYDADHFISEAREVWQTVNYSKGSLTPYQFSFIFNLSKRRGTRVEVERELEDLYGGPVELRLDEILRRGVEAGAFQDQPDEPTEFVEEVKATKHQPESHSDENESDSLWAKTKDFFGFGAAKRERENSRRNSSGRRSEILTGLADNETAAQEDRDFPDEPNPRDM
jgi:hypothetical protein